MAESFVGQQLHHAVAGGFPVFCHVQAEHRAQFFARVGVFRRYGGLFGDQYFSAGRDTEARHLAEVQRGFADHFRVDGAVRAQQQRRHFRRFIFIHKVGTLRFQLAVNLVVNAAFDDDRLLGGADHPIIEGFAGDDIFHRVVDIGAAFDKRRAVARAAADGWGAGRIGRTHHAFAAGGEDQRHVFAVHQLRGGFERQLGDAVDAALRRTGRFRRAFDDFNRLPAALTRARMRGEDNGVAGLEGDQRFVDNRRGWVR